MTTIIKSRTLTPEEIIGSYKREFRRGLISTRLDKKTAGIKKIPVQKVYINVNKGIFKESVKHLFTMQPYPHFIVISGDDDIGSEEIGLNYHFSVNYGTRLKEILVTISVKIPKMDLKIETISDLIPGAVITERETQEMWGVDIVGLPDKRRMFLSEEFPIDIYPWRKDEKGVNEKVLRTLNDKDQIRKKR